MATNPPGKGKAVIACSVPEEVAAEIIRRAKSLKWTKSKYAGLLLERWYNTGAATVTTIEEALRYQQQLEQSQRVAEQDQELPRGPSQQSAG